MDFLRRTIAVQRQVQRTQDAGVEVRAPKYGSERNVYASELLLELLAAHLPERRPGTDPSRPLFLGDDGGLLHQNSVGHYWPRVPPSRATGRDAARDCRNYYASGLIAAGCDVVTVQRALGHAEAPTTLNTYAHLWPTAEDRTRRAAEELLAAALAVPADRVRTTGTA